MYSHYEPQSRTTSPTAQEAPPSYSAHEESPLVICAAPTPIALPERPIAVPVAREIVLSSRTTQATQAAQPAGVDETRPPGIQFGVRYRFVQRGASAMVLVPPREAADGRPLYHISVHTNVFKPQSFITVVHYGATEDGPYVGEFEYGPHEHIRRVVVGKTAKAMHAVATFSRRLMTKPRSAWNALQWVFDDVVLYWEPETQSSGGQTTLCWKCVTKDSGRRVRAHLATFHPANILLARGGTPPMPALVFEQPGMDLIYHILLSVLPLQREDRPLPVATYD